MTIDDETSLLIMAYHDGELSPAETLAMERRFASEPALRAFADDLQKLSGRLKMTLSADPAPPEELRAKIIKEIGFAEALPVRPVSQSWMALAATLLVGMIAGGGLVAALTFGSGSPRQSLTDGLLAAHLRGLSAPQPFDIASSDRHVVKPWFNGKTAISPTAPDLGANGFALIGGRVDIADGAPVPTLVYRHDRHIISVTVLPRQGASAQGGQTHDGSNIESWDLGDLTYWAVSDLNKSDLQQFVTDFKAAAQ